jgi:hypothetical protein
MRFTVGLTAAALWATAAGADWQNTRWGMPLGNLLALPGVLPPSETESKTKSDYGRAAAKSVYPVEGIPFDAYYLVTDDRLTGVKLMAGTSSTDASKILSLLDSIYGRPVREKENSFQSCFTRFRLFRDDGKNNLVTAETLACGASNTLITITYSPLNGTNQPGGL